MNRKLLSILDELEDQTEDAIKVLELQASQASEDIYEYVSEFVSDLKRSKTGGIAASIENLRAIDKFKARLSRYIESSEYGQSVSAYIKEFSNNITIINTYYSTLITSYSPKINIQRLILEESASLTVDTLLQSGLSDKFITPVTRILKDSVVNGTSRTAASRVIKEFIIDNKELSKHVGRVSGDLITQFNSNYIQSISSDLGLSHYFYKGTKIATSRHLCERLAGKYYTEDELKTIINSSKPWAGMIPGTTWTTFPKYRGGYNCRHYLIPVSKELYDAYSK